MTRHKVHGRLDLFSAVLLVLIAYHSSVTNAFSATTRKVGPHQPNGIPTSYDTRRQRLLVLKSFGTQGETSSLLEEIRSMRIKEIKDELVALKISTTDVFEKEELVQRLYKARQISSTQQPTPSTNPQTQSTQGVLEAPLYLTSLETGTRIAAVDGANIQVEAKDHPYPTIKVEVIPNSGSPFTLTLLLDTACSGLVLRPSVVQKYNLPSLSTPVTMTGAGGTASNTGLTQLDRFRLASQTFGPLPAAVQDIGALPSALDGIIGLSFLNQFEAVDFDFGKGQLFLYPKGTSLPDLSSKMTVVAEGDMSLVPTLGIYVVDVFLRGQGPVKMLVDTGASDTFLNWLGVSDLSLSRDSKFLNRLPNPMGAVGSDAVAMQLTHRINISSNLNLGKAQKQGLTLKDSRRLSIDIGDIAILESLRGDRVGGILGIDVLMRCDAVRMTFQASKSIQLLLNNEEANAAE